jgi:hypothetical protein
VEVLIIKEKLTFLSLLNKLRQPDIGRKKLDIKIDKHGKKGQNDKFNYKHKKSPKVLKTNNLGLLKAVRRGIEPLLPG